MSTRIHIYAASWQPATNWVDANIDPPGRGGFSAGTLIWCDCCGKRRRAANVVLQIYFDSTRRWCAPDKGCRDPRVIAAKRRREHRNRSAGQIRRWARVARERGRRRQSARAGEATHA